MYPVQGISKHGMKRINQKVGPYSRSRKVSVWMLLVTTAIFLYLALATSDEQEDDSTYEVIQQ